MSTADVGDAVVVSYEVRDQETGALVNPSTVVLTVTLPNLTTQTPTVTNPPPETGIFEVTWLYTAAGRHIFKDHLTTTVSIRLFGLKRSQGTGCVVVLNQVDVCNNGRSERVNVLSIKNELAVLGGGCVKTA